MNEDKELEEAKKYLKLMKMDKNNLNKIGYVYGTEAIKTVLEALEKYKRLAEANLKDSEEFKNNMCGHRCILKSQLQELQENSIPKKKIEDKIKEYEKLVEDFEKTDNSGRFKRTNSIDYYKLEALKEILKDNKSKEE